MTRYNLPDRGSVEWYSSPIYPAVADLDRRIGDTKDTSTSLAAQIAALQTAVTTAQAAANAAQTSANNAQTTADAANAVKPYWYGYLFSNQTINNVSNTLVPWTQDTAFGGITYSAGVVMVPIAGRYRITAVLNWDPSTSATPRMCQVYSGSTGGNPMITAAAYGPNAARPITTAAIKSIPLAAGAQFRVLGYQEAGGTLQVQGAATKNLSYFQVEYLGLE